MNIRDQIAAKLVGKYDPERRESGDMIVALNQTSRHIYAGTVPRAEIDRRRAKNKVARRSRRINRSRA